MFETMLPALPLIPLYAEIHYRFRFFPFSLYFRKAPEIIFDCPWRISPAHPPTVFLLIKDAHRWPITLQSVTMRWETDKGESGQESFSLSRKITTPWFFQAVTLNDRRLRRPTQLSLVPTLQFILRGKQKSVTIDNFRGLTKNPLKTYLADEHLPALKGWRAGDIHVHSHLTADQVEFGAPLEMTQQGAHVLGMKFVTPTDHSYDLDDKPDDYLNNDPQLTKWHASRETMLRLNAAFSQRSRLIPSEEITIRNQDQHNVHLLHLNDPQFYPGSGDGAERWLKTKSELDLAQVLETRSEGTVSIAAHPHYKVPFLHRLLIDRDEWHINDLQTDGLDGAQVLSGTPDSRDFSMSRKRWIDALVNGYRLAIYGGSDAHGNFNNFRQVKMPMVKLFMLDDQILGQARTLVYSEGTDPEALVAGMQQRRTAATTGPAGNLQLTTSDGERYQIGDDVGVSADALIVDIEGISTREFGPVASILLFQGNLTTQQESIIWEKVPATQVFRVAQTIKLRISEPSYFRLEIKTPGNGRWPGVYLSTPIWVHPL